jgi:hypothetical protein
MSFPHFVTARLWEPIQPVARGERYEDPLQAALEKAGLGQVDGGGSALLENGEIAYADVTMYLKDLEGALELTRATLEAAGAPERSELQFAAETGREPLAIGRQQLMALYLDGVNLPDEVYAELDFDAVLAEIEQALAQPTPALHDTWTGNEETGLYFFGDDAEAMWTRAEATLRRLPICQNARVVLRHNHPDLPGREIRLPRH